MENILEIFVNAVPIRTKCFIYPHQEFIIINYMTWIILDFRLLLATQNKKTIFPSVHCTVSTVMISDVTLKFQAMICSHAVVAAWCCSTKMQFKIIVDPWIVVDHPPNGTAYSQSLSFSSLLTLTPTTGRVKYFDTAIYMLSAIRFRRHVHSHDEIWTYNFHPMLLCYGGKFSNKQRKCVQPRSVRCARAYCAHIIASRKIHMKRNRWRRKTRRYIGK